MPVDYERLLVPVTGAANDQRALGIAVDLACRRPLDIILVYVVEVQQAMPLDAELPDEIERGEFALNQAETYARRLLGAKYEQLTTDLLQARSAGAAIVDEAIERRVDAILIAGALRSVHGKTSMSETVVHILRNAPCDVVVVRESMGEAQS